MAKLNCPKCPDFDGFAMCTSTHTEHVFKTKKEDI